MSEHVTRLNFPNRLERVFLFTGLPIRGEVLAVDDAMRTQAWQPQPLLARSDDRQYDMQEDADELTDLVDQLAADEDRWNQY